MIFTKKILLIFITFLQCISCEYNYNFLNDNFRDFFSTKLKLVNIPNKNEIKIICSEKIFQNDLIFSIPLGKIIKPANVYVHQAEIDQILKSFHVEENLADTVSLIIYTLMKKFYEKKENNNENQNFINGYLMSIDSERNTLLWWDKLDLEFVRNSLYYFNEIWIENMIKETDSAIALTKEILRDFQKKHVSFSE